jgi:lipopolysaccharide/colanic/teichoic acid biosynthesis glycosyltransferase
LRDEQTWLARLVRELSPARAETYLGSPDKRTLDLLVSIPAAAAAAPVIATLGALNKLLYPDHPAFFRQERVGRQGHRLPVFKIRSMVPAAEHDPEYGTLEANEGVRCTALGLLMRRYFFDELPQIVQVLIGQLSLVGIRVLPAGVYADLARAWSPRRFAEWNAVYDATPLGLTGIHQVFRGAGKEDRRRYHRDMFYARNASLGLDLYLIWRTLGKTDR